MAIAFNGVDQYGHSSESFTLNRADEDSTLAFFVRPQTLTATGYPVAANEDAADFQFLAARMEPTSDIAGRHKLSTDATTAYTTLTNDAWTPVVVTYTAATHTVTLYAGSTTGVSASNSDTTASWDTFTVGAAHGVGSTPADYFKGKVAYAMFFERLWNSTEISGFINATSVADINAISTTGLVARYDLIADGNADGAGVGLTLVGTPTFDSDDPLAATISITSVSTDDIFTDGATGIPITGVGLNTVTSAIVETSDSAYQVDVTASYSATDANNATFNHTRGTLPLTTAGYQLRLKLSDGTNTVTRNVQIEPVSGEQVTELAGTLVLTDPESVFAPYTGPDPVVGDQYIVPTTTTQGGVLLPNADSTFSIDYSGLASVPATDSFAVEWWSDNGTTGRVWSGGTINISEPAAEVTSVTVPVDGTYGPGDPLQFTVNWATAVTVTGTPQLNLTLGTDTVLADYVSGSGSTATVFQATVPSADTATGSLTVNSLGLNGGTITDGGGANATLTLNNIGSTAGISIDTTGPVVASVSVPTSGTYFQGDTLAFTVNWDESVSATGTPRLALTIGATTRYANYASQTGVAALRFTYTIQNGDLDTNGIQITGLELNGGTIKDGADNDATLTLNSVGSTTGVLVDAEAPTITSITPPASATYDINEDLTFTVNWSEAITVTGTPRLALDIGGVTEYANYVSGTGTSALVFTYTIVNTNLYDMDGVTVSALELSGGTLKNSVAADADLTLVGTTTFTGVLVDTATPAGTITFGAPSVTGTTISQPFAYSASDATGYEYRVDAGAWVAFTASPAEITGLTAGTTYSIDVRPTNSFGAGDTSNTSVATAAATSPPAGTVTITGVTTTTTTADVTFTYSDTDETGYQYRIDSGAWVAVSASPISLTGLTAGTAYLFEIQAVNADGGGTIASTTINTDAANVPQGTVTFGTATVAETLASIPFTYDLSDQTGFEYRVDGGTWFAISGSPVALAGLTAGTTYAVDVRAVNANGGGTAFSTSITTDALNPPVGTITFGTATLSQTTASVPFTYSASDQDFFEYRLDSGSWITVTSPVSLSGLNPEQTYTLEVKAVNSDGDGSIATTTVTTLAEQSSTIGGLSGTYDFNLQVDEIIEEAYERIGMESTSGYDLRTARRSLNLLLTEWVNKDITLWTAERRSINCVSGQATYDLRERDVDVMEVALRTSGSDIVLSRVSWDQSMYTADKDQAGRPVQYKFDRQLTPQLTLWPVPDSNSYSLVVDVFKFIQDVGSYYNVIGAPRRFLPAMVAGLAFYLAEKRRPELVATKKALYDEALEEALAADEEVKSFVIRPNRGGRYRRR